MLEVRCCGCLVCFSDHSVVACRHRRRRGAGLRRVRGCTTRHRTRPTCGCRWRWPPSERRASASGPGVLIPSLRHPMVNAAGTATLEAMAPGRVAVSFGTGFTGRRAMGYGAITWKFMTEYIEAFRALLRGEVITWEGARMQMLQPEGSAAPRPVDVPILVGALGPKGQQVARDLGDGLYVALNVDEAAKDFSWVAFLYWGTVLDEGEAADTDRVRAAAGPGWALLYHSTYEFADRAAVEAIPGGEQWLKVHRRAARGRGPSGRARRPLHPHQRRRCCGVGRRRVGAGRTGRPSPVRRRRCATRSISSASKA